ncbi:dephospho-CoA kinase [uncultured Nonlabens sp.]|jgi:dephospho-CoA kinase|uniref:dephospho-CoA kinase n=1 Tax=uncultured Nonlabens sp. TaxID=859306 RepID=UPI0030DD467B|tara:strand:+ start:1808 stop:2401 length:594 start_codon:yes stop_codon:yes gene_type:complete
MKIVGLTGGIGSGKSTVAREFENLGIPIFIADDVSKKILATDPQIIEAVINLLGKNSYDREDNGIVVPNKKYIASKVFSDKMLLTSLNKIMHPAVRAYFKEWILQQNFPYIIYEAAVLFESNSHLLCDKVVLVTAGIEERIRRVMDRDTASRAEVVSRLGHQWSEGQRLELSDFVIVNEDLQQIAASVWSIHEVLLK